MQKAAKIFNGIPASSGIGLGKPWILARAGTNIQPEKINPEHTKAELEHFKNAVKKIELHFEEMIDDCVDEEIKKIIESQLLVLNDPELQKTVTHRIEVECYSAVYSIFDALNDYIKLLDAADAKWAKDRTVDIVSIRDQLVMAVQQKEIEQIQIDGAIVFAEEISPTEMIRLSRSQINGIVLHKGGLTSHAVILAQSLGIPCVVGVDWSAINPMQHELVIIDGEEGDVIYSPGKKLQNKLKVRGEKQEAEKKEILQWADKPSETKCGSPFTIRGNIEFENELPRLKTHGAEGVGLLRTETILFQSRNFDVDEQVKFYRTVLESADGKPVTIRLFDAGGDKLLDNYKAEANPFLGWRGIRMLLDEKDLLVKQIEAIYRISGSFKGLVRIIAPMISTLEEVEQLKQIITDVSHNLIEAGVKIDSEIPVGIMVEVPAVAIMAESFAGKVDFFSIGTNDLTQYTLAADRGNERISRLFKPAHPAIWKLIGMIKKGADAGGIPVSVCGEMASIPEFAACFLGMGITELSMTTNQIPRVKSALCSSEIKDLKKLAGKVLSAESLPETEQLLLNWKKQMG